MNAMDNILVEGVTYVDNEKNKIVHEQPLGQLTYTVNVTVGCDNFARLSIPAPT